MEIEVPSWSSEAIDRLKTVRVASLKEIPKLKGVVVVDLDGFLCLRGKENNLGDNLLRLREFLRIIDETDRVLISTARVDSKCLVNFIDSFFEERRESEGLAVSYCPILTRQSKINLEKLIHVKNPNSIVDFDADPRKLIGFNEKTLRFGRVALDEGLDFTVLGSGLVDQRIAKKIGRDNGSFENICFYSRGWGLV